MRALFISGGAKILSAVRGGNIVYVTVSLPGSIIRRMRVEAALRGLSMPKTYALVIRAGLKALKNGAKRG